MIDFMWLAGTGHPAGGDGISDTFAAALDPGLFTFHFVEYPAAYGRPSYGVSAAAGVSKLVDAIRRTPNLCCIGGYSQGAAAAGNLAGMLGEPHVYGLTDLEVLAVGLISDPLRDGTQPVIGHDPGGSGIGGARKIDGMVNLRVAAVGDPITALPAGNPLRSIADFSEYMSRDFQAWIDDLQRKARSGLFQQWWNPANIATWLGALRWLSYYTHGGRHTDAYITEGLAVALAHEFNRTFEYTRTA